MLAKQQNVLLCVSGGIAAYKAPELVRRLSEQGCVVRVVLSGAATHFVGRSALHAVSGHPVRDDLWDEAAEAAMGHIELARWADLVLVAPATANTLAKLANGVADNLLTTLCLATQAPIFVAPAMNRVMWAHGATQENLATLRGRGVAVLGPDDGEQACGEVGVGRMMDVPDLVNAITADSQQPSQRLAGKKLLITAGPTREAIDPVRYISNYSSGKMGFALAQAAAEQGAAVTLIAGPVALSTPPGVERIDVQSAEQMRQAVAQSTAPCDAFYAVAAVADARPATQAPHKLKKEDGLQDIALVTNVDIVAEVAARPDRPQVVVAFAAESNDHSAHARSKLDKKGVDFIAVNNILGEDSAFAADDNALTLFAAQSDWPEAGVSSGRLNKLDVAKWLLDSTL